MKPTILLLIITLFAIPNVTAAQDTSRHGTLHPSTQSMTVETLLAALIDHNLSRASRLHDFSVQRTYVVKDDKNKSRAESEVRLSYQAPDRKEFSIISEKGSGLVRGRVFKALLESEVEAAAGKAKRDSSITPANYTFELLGEEDMDGFHTFVVHAIPKRKDKYLFEGKVWIEATEFAIVRIEGHPAENPSFWIKKVNFVRRYQRIDGFWFPLRDETVTEVRLVGKNFFTIDHGSYEINRSSALNRETAQNATHVK
jgi:Outer membrane lipoprotein-sorting protein